MLVASVSPGGNVIAGNGRSVEGELVEGGTPVGVLFARCAFGPLDAASLAGV